MAMKDDVLVIYKESWLDGLAFDKWKEELDAEGRDDSLNDDMRESVKQMYSQLKDMIEELTPTQYTRITRYLNSETLDDITDNEITRQAVHNVMTRVFDKWGWDLWDLKKARLIWAYGKLYIES